MLIHLVHRRHRATRYLRSPAGPSPPPPAPAASLGQQKSELGKEKTVSRKSREPSRSGGAASRSQHPDRPTSRDANGQGAFFLCSVDEGAYIRAHLDGAERGGSAARMNWAYALPSSPTDFAAQPEPAGALATLYSGGGPAMSPRTTREDSARVDVLASGTRLPWVTSLRAHDGQDSGAEPQRALPIAES